VSSGSKVQTVRSSTVFGLFLLLVAALFVLPYWWMIASSLKDQFSIFSDVSPISPATFIPSNPTLDNFAWLVENRSIHRALLNSAFVAVGQVVGTVVVCSLAAYALTRIRFPGRDFLFLLVLVTFLVPTEALVVPLYQVVSGYGLANNLTAAFLPWLASPFGLFLLRQAFDEIPRELDEAAVIDGASHWQVFWHVILPNARTALATLCLMTFLFAWNAFLWPLVILSSRDLTVVQVAIAQSVVPGELPNWGTTFAGATIASLPVLLLFVLLQRYFIRGIAMTGIK